MGPQKGGKGAMGRAPLAKPRNQPNFLAKSPDKAIPIAVAIGYRALTSAIFCLL